MSPRDSSREPAPRGWRGRRCLALGSRLDRLRGRDAMQDLPRLRQMEWWDAEAYDAHRQERLAELLDFCWQQVPFYRRRIEAAGLERSDLADALPALQALPPLTKAELREHGESLLTEPPESLATATTSGSTGAPVRVWQDRHFAGWSRALLRRAFLWHGVEYYEPRVFLLGTPAGPVAALKQRLIDRVIGRRLVSFHGLDDAGYGRVLRTIEKFRPAYITAYPSVLDELCRYAARTGQDLRGRGIRLLHSQSEMLLDTHRESFREVFGDVPVLNEYGCVEIGAMAFSCPAGTLHICHEQVVFEVVDDGGQPVPPGTTGRILLTPLEARGMPLLRYEIGDAGTLSEEACSCGRMAGTAVLERLDGRLFEQILGLGGERFNAGIVHFLMRRAGLAQHLAEYLAVQRRPGELELLLVPRPAASPDEETSGGETPNWEALVQEAKRLFGQAVVASYRLVDTIPRPPRGAGAKKRGYFRSEISEP
ncbi:MAG: AMP-binding protein [Acidobacteriota bacterium]|nr:AMP-binding protein [Acidobacteriota bacterium]